MVQLPPIGSRPYCPRCKGRGWIVRLAVVRTNISIFPFKLVFLKCRKYGPPLQPPVRPLPPQGSGGNRAAQTRNGKCLICDKQVPPESPFCKTCLVEHRADLFSQSNIRPDLDMLPLVLQEACGTPPKGMKNPAIYAQPQRVYRG